MSFNREQFITLHTILETLEEGKRLAYLEKLGEVWESLKASPDFVVDERDYNIYSILRIGNQEWLGENLRYKGVPYGENPNNPTLFYGCFYDWATMMNIDERYNKEQWNGPTQGHQGIAPEGWCIPSDEDWKELERNMGMVEIELDKLGERGSTEGRQLKSTWGWNNKGGGDNSSGFNAYATGHSWYGQMTQFRLNTYLASSSQHSEKEVYHRYLLYSVDRVARYFNRKTDGNSLRCVRTREKSKV